MIIATFAYGGEKDVLISLRLCSGGMLVPYQAPYPSVQPAAILSYCHLCRIVLPSNRNVKHCSLCMQCIPGQVRRPYPKP